MESGPTHPVLEKPALPSLPDGPRLNLGCGPVQPPGWINIDGSMRAKLASWFNPMDRLLVKLGVLSPTEFGPNVKVCNLFRPLPYADRSISCIYAGELWEHFEYADAHRLTNDCFRVLAPGGVLRVCVPDGVQFWKRYLDLVATEVEKPQSERVAERIKAHVSMYFNEICTRRIWFGSMGHTHKWQFDEVQLIEMFETNGFINVERKSFHDSRMPNVDDVESSDFLIVEGSKATD